MAAVTSHERSKDSEVFTALVLQTKRGVTRRYRYSVSFHLTEGFFVVKVLK